MANTMYTCRTNYFKVKDEEAYEQLFAGLSGEDTVEDFTCKNEKGEILHGFGCYGWIDWYGKDNDPDDGYGDIDAFFDKMKDVIADDDVFILFTSGYEKLRVVFGDVVVVSSKEVRFETLESWALEAAREMLGDKTFKTRMSY